MINYLEIYRKCLINKRKKITIKETLKEFGINNNANFYNYLSEKQKEKLFNAKKLSKKQKELFIKLYNEGWTANDLRKKFKIKTHTALKISREIIGEKENTMSLKNCRRKLSKYQVKKILITYMRYGRGGRWGNGEITQKEIAIKYGMSECVINNIINGRNWKHVFQGFKKKYNLESLQILKTK